ncbi:Ubiquitin [Fulvia fulva]|uniref:Ubiquitin n=1 Tax=Passalora fulva TaxID=5499 RepID=A0A9Q8LEB6_PASFU|nr:Ubiquitin [Fulvia fulva]KAK4616345.1 Ubiquitin [Fulvia fulva]KAK4617288.1 Ubiquitin [Fulvia fulva]UJO15835.1 Ubiquitin [Fulvia fulva]WPV19531.1 Ubiquitin [Fulvia fulva]WPV34408.1 Ubiquitin [Fulvia fulva]
MNAIASLRTAFVANFPTIVAAVDTTPYNITAPVRRVQAPPPYTPAQKTYTINLVQLNGRRFQLSITNATTVDELARKIQDREGIPPDEQRLIFAGQQMEHSHNVEEDEEDTEGGKPLKEYGVQAGSTIHIVTRLCGS